MSRCVLCDRSVPHVCDYSDVGHEPEDIIASLRDEVERLRAENTWLKTSDEAIPFARRTIDGQRAAKAKEAAGTLMAEMLTERSHRVAATRRAEQLTALVRELADIVHAAHVWMHGGRDCDGCDMRATLARVREVLGEASEPDSPPRR